jgi:glycosyltransferase involved in cell wall biosynthesis
VLPLGVDVSAFRASVAAREARRARILRPQPLRVLYVGALSLQKGLVDLVSAADVLRDEAFEFALVGPRMAETDQLLARAAPNVRVLPKRPQRDLPPVYADADLFLFPTIQDGFGMVLTQARASGLPILTTSNGGGPDLVTEGRDGWIVSIRDVQAIVARLRWCAANRSSLAEMADSIDDAGVARDWSDVARDFATIARDAVASKEAEVSVHRG